MDVPTAASVLGSGPIRASATFEVDDVAIQATQPAPGDAVDVQVCGTNADPFGRDGSGTIDVAVNGTVVASVTLAADHGFSDCNTVSVTVPDADTMTASAGGRSDTVDVVDPEPDPEIVTTSVNVLDDAVAGDRVEIEVCATNFGGTGSESFDIVVNGEAVTAIDFFVVADSSRCAVPNEAIPVPDADQLTVSVGGTSHTVPVSQPELDPASVTAECAGVRAAGEVVDGRWRVGPDTELVPTATVTNDGDVRATTNVAFHWAGELLGGAFDVDVAPGETVTDITPEETPIIPRAVAGLDLPVRGPIVAEAQNPQAASAPVATDGGVRAGAADRDQEKSGGCGCGCGCGGG